MTGMVLNTKYHIAKCVLKQKNNTYTGLMMRSLLG